MDQAEALKAMEGFGWDEMAIITCRDRIRTGMLTELVRRQIPFTMHGPIATTGLNDVQRVLTSISLLVRPHDRSALVDSILWADTDFTDRRRSALDASIALVSREDTVPPMEACVRLLDEGLITSARTRFALERILATHRFLEQHLDDNAGTIKEFLRLACEELQGPRLGHPATGAASHMANLLLGALRETDPPPSNMTIREVLNRLLTYWDLSEYNGVPDREGLTIATVDAAAGSEWPCVWLIDASDHLMPGNCGSEEESARQQRRFYVASSRAAVRLFYCNARGGGRGFEAIPSRYIAVLGKLVERRDIDTSRGRRG